SLRKVGSPPTASYKGSLTRQWCQVSWASTSAGPARRRSSWASTWAGPARRRSSWASTWAGPARRRSSWASTWAGPARRRSSVGLGRAHLAAGRKAGGGLRVGGRVGEGDAGRLGRLGGGVGFAGTPDRGLE